jgi:hypothetical protein
MLMGSLSTVSNGTLSLERFSSVSGGKLLPGFLFMQGESDGLEQGLSIKIGGGRGKPVPFVPDDSCDDAIFDGASPDLRSPQLPCTHYQPAPLELLPKACQFQPRALEFSLSLSQISSTTLGAASASLQRCP